MYTISKDPPKKHLLSTQIDLSKFSAAQFEAATEEEKRQQDNQKHLKIFLEDDKLEILNGRYGPYLSYDGKNYRLPKNLHEKAKQLTYDECMKIIQAPVKKS